MLPASVVVYEKSQKFWISRAIGIACELNLSDVLKSGPKRVDELAVITQTNEESLYRVMRALAGEGIFRESKYRVFSNTSLSIGLTEGEGSMKYMILHQLNKTNWEMIGHLDYPLKTGKCPAIDLLGNDIFTHLEQHPDKNELYNKAMTGTSSVIAAAFLARYNFSGKKLIVDIGGGEGYLLSVILSKYSHLHGIVFDLPHVVKKADENFRRFGIEDRAIIREGNFFGILPSDGDIYIMKNILHAFDDNTCVKLLKNIHSAVQTGTTLLIIEAVIEENNKPAYGKLIDLQMLIGTDGGKERTRKEFENILHEAGFVLKRIVHTVSPFSIVEAIKIEK